jgi:poly(3-hydroxybutyrate) depolymerase
MGDGSATPSQASLRGGILGRRGPRHGARGAPPGALRGRLHPFRVRVRGGVGACTGAERDAQWREHGSRKIGEEARARAGGAVRLPVMVLHGDRDSVVAEINASQVARQFLALNGYSRSARPAGELPPPDAESRVTLPSGRTVTTSEYRDGRRVAVRIVRVADLDHAWSGGDPSFPYNDPQPPDATKLLGEFAGRSAITLSW